MKEKENPYLTIYSDKSILHDSDGIKYEYIEGKLSASAQKRLKAIKENLEKGFLEKLIEECSSPNVEVNDLTDEQKETIINLVNSITSEVGRALVGLLVLQLTVKSLDTSQSIRLHKGSSNSGAFSWSEGIPMRVLDKNYITPVLRKYDLLRLNADGFMMTRSLAENYPYSKLYKAAIRGGRDEWLVLVDLIEKEKINPLNSLKYLLVQLLNKSIDFNKNADELLLLTKSYLNKKPTYKQIFDLIKLFINSSTYSARIFEIVIHCLFQAIDSQNCFSGYLVPLSQMRSANKKHGNIGDIELSFSPQGNDIIESWDAKYGKTYLRDELEELNEKL